MRQVIGLQVSCEPGTRPRIEQDQFAQALSLIRQTGEEERGQTEAGTDLRDRSRYLQRVREPLEIVYKGEHLIDRDRAIAVHQCASS